jgi:hypothetical protein
MPAQIIPITNAPNQTLRAAVAINGQTATLNLTVKYNSYSGFWTMDVSDQAGTLLVASVPLVTGSWPAANILAPFDYLQIGSAYVINQNGAATDWPDDTDLGTDFLILWDDNLPFVA